MVKVPSNFKLVPPPDDKDESQQAFDESQQAFYNLVQDKILADPSRYCEPGDPRADGKGWVSTGDKGIECVGYVPPVYAERNRPKTDLPLPLGDDDPDLLDKCAVLAVVHDFGTKTVTKLAPWLAVQQDLPLRDVGGEENIRIAVLRYPFDTLLGKVGDLSEADKRPIEKFLADVLADLGTPTATGGVDDSEWSQEMGKSQLAKVLDMHPNTLAKRIKNGDIAVREISSKRIKVRLSDLPEEARKRWA